jgi:hypothetical protein
LTYHCDRSRKPTLPASVSSNVCGDGATATPNAGSVVAALRKPVRIDALLEALDGAGGR